MLTRHELEMHMNRTRLFLASVVCLTALFGPARANAATDARAFLAPYTNPEQQKLPADGIYPLGQRMLISGYASNKSQLLRMSKAGFSLDGPHYHGAKGPPNWETAEAEGMKNFFRLRPSNYKGRSGWNAVLPQMKTEEGRANIRKHIVRMIDYVQSNPKLDSNIVGWYGSPEEIMKRKGMTLDEQRAHYKLVHAVIEATDKKKRPLYISERGDSSRANMTANQRYQDGVIQQNFLIVGNGYGGDDEMRVMMWQWARDQVVAAEKADELYPSYTGRPRAAISTPAMWRDPKDKSKRNRDWLKRIIPHDIYLQLAAGIDGFAAYAWACGADKGQATTKLQKDIYVEVLGRIAREGLGKVFLWGDDRDDITLDIVEGPKTIKWKKYRKWYDAPSIRMRNIQYGGNRYILLVNSAKEVVRPRLSEFPKGMMLYDMLSTKWSELGAGHTATLKPLDVRMYKIGLVRDS